MNKILILFTVLLLLTGCSGGPSEGDIANSLETQMKADSQAYIDQMKGLVGDKGIASALKMAGMPHPDDISIEDLELKDMNEKENGDYVAKVTFITIAGEKKNKVSARLTLTALDDAWKVIDLQAL